MLELIRKDSKKDNGWNDEDKCGEGKRKTSTLTRTG